MNFYIHSIYKATEGEGVFVGMPQIFVRFQGCSIGCLNCDSKETWDFNSNGKNYDIIDLYSEVLRESMSIKRISITGGDPMHPKHLPAVKYLAKFLKDKGHFINIEASGTRVDEELFDTVDFISFDFKTPSTGVKTSLELVKEVALKYPGKYQIKSVVQDRVDYEYVLSAKKELSKSYSGLLNWVITPAYTTSDSFNVKDTQDVLKWNEECGGDFRVISQQHKFVYGTESLRV